MERKEFLAKLGLGMVVVCTGCSLASCGGSKNSDPTPQGTPPPAPGSGEVFTVDLSSQILNVGDSKMMNGIILVRIAVGSNANSFTAVQSACTHEGTTIGYDNMQSIFICPLHGSEFNKAGQVLLGPAATPLQQFRIAINNNILTVSA